MYKKIIISTLSITTFVVIATLLVSYFFPTPASINSIGSVIKTKDDQFEKVLFMMPFQNSLYVFYKGNENISVAVIDDTSKKQGLRILGSTSFRTDNGFSTGTIESKGIGIFIAYGIISDNRIKQVYINDALTNLIKLDDTSYLWCELNNAPFSYPLQVKALEQNGHVVYKN